MTTTLPASQFVVVVLEGGSVVVDGSVLVVDDARRSVVDGRSVVEEAVVVLLMLVFVVEVLTKPATVESADLLPSESAASTIPTMIAAMITSAPTLLRDVPSTLRRLRLDFSSRMSSLVSRSDRLAISPPSYAAGAPAGPAPWPPAETTRTTCPRSFGRSADASRKG